MSTAVQSKNPLPLQNFGYCALLMKCEFIEIACRIKNVVVHIFFTIGQMIVDSVKWVLRCGRPLDSPHTLHLKLPILSPDFEKEALKLASVWLTPDEMEDINCMLDASLFSQIVVRAAMLAGRSPIHLHPNGRPKISNSYQQFSFDCKELHRRFNALSASDKTAILSHLDSDLTPIKENGKITGYRLTSSRDKPDRPCIPPPATISTAARDLWTDYKVLAGEGIRHDHPVMKGFSHVSADSELAP